MRDPHVEWLEYEMKADSPYESPLPVKSETPLFEVILNNGICRVKLLNHFSTEEDARAAVRPFLQSWEIYAALIRGDREMTFEFRRAQLVDRDPFPPGSIIMGAVRMAGHASVSATARVTRTTYPAVPSNFVADPDVVTLWNRFEGFKNGCEPLSGMAYFCCTVVEHWGGAGSRKDACLTLSVDPSVLNKVGELSSNRGDSSTARKMTSQLAPFTSNEAAWLEAAILALIHRVGEIAAGNFAAGNFPLPLLTMKELPPL